MIQSDSKTVDKSPRHEGGICVAKLMDECHVETKPSPRGSRDAQNGGSSENRQQRWQGHDSSLDVGEATDHSRPPGLQQVHSRVHSPVHSTEDLRRERSPATRISKPKSKAASPRWSGGPACANAWVRVG